MNGLLLRAWRGARLFTPDYFVIVKSPKMLGLSYKGAAILDGCNRKFKKFIDRITGAI
jgi:hypothetical protein